MNERISNIINHPLRVPVGVGVASFALGTGLGYFLGQRSKPAQDGEAEEKKDDISPGERVKSMTGRYPDREVLIPVSEERLSEEEAADNLSAANPATTSRVVIDSDEFQEFVEQRNQQIEELRGDSSAVEEPSEPEPERQNVFAHDDPDWNYAEEVANRTKEAPYVLHKDEFYANEHGYTQTTLTYYAGDDTMTDEKEVPVYNWDVVIGPLKFGHGTNDPNVFHVRNDHQRAEYEIVRHDGRYEIEVLGYELEQEAEASDLKHSRQPHRFRQE